MFGGCVCFSLYVRPVLIGEQLDMDVDRLLSHSLRVRAFRWTPSLMLNQSQRRL